MEHKKGAKMKKRLWLVLIIVLTLSALVISPVMAVDDPGPPDELEEEEPEEPINMVTHPIVKLLASYYAFLFQQPPLEGLPEGEQPPTSVTPEESIAQLFNEEDLGFGVMVKLLQMTAEAKSACEKDGTHCDVSLDSLVDRFQSGEGLGELFQEYGKPQVTGVGQIRQAEDPVDNPDVASGKPEHANAGKGRDKADNPGRAAGKGKKN